jgi:hypothetical protein
MVSSRRAQPAPPLMPCHFAPCDRLLCRFQERAEIFKLGDQSVLDGDHMVGTLTLALEVCPVTTRALFGPTKLGFKFGDPRFECDDHVRDRPVTSR